MLRMRRARLSAGTLNRAGAFARAARFAAPSAHSFVIVEVLAAVIIESTIKTAHRMTNEKQRKKIEEHRNMENWLRTTAASTNHARPRARARALRRFRVRALPV